MNNPRVDGRPKCEGKFQEGFESLQKVFQFFKVLSSKFFQYVTSISPKSRHLEGIVEHSKDLAGAEPLPPNALSVCSDQLESPSLTNGD